ncbi:MAG: alpha/beta fold hydrolase [Phycisphaerae bacterium]
MVRRHLFPKIAITALLTAIGGGPQRAAADDPDENQARIELARAFADDLAHGRFDDAAKPFDDRMRQVLPAVKLRATWDQITAQTGNLKGFGKPQARTESGLHIVYVPASFERAERVLKIVFDVQDRISGFWIVEGAPPSKDALPEYAHPDRYKQQDVVFAEKPWTIQGKLTRPRAGKPGPVIVLVHGSGPHDEDETIGPNKPFRDLAVGLSSNGISVLRYQKRTYAHKDQFVGHPSITLREEVIDDALTALRFIRTRPEVDAKRVFLLGHSLGGTLGPHIADEDGKLAGLILLAGTPRDFFDILPEQLEYIASLPGPQQEQTRKVLDETRKTIARLRKGGDPAGAAILGAPAEYWLELTRMSQASLKVVAGLSCRMLVLGGGRDYQVTKTDFDLYRRAAEHRKGVTFRWFDKMNHLFIRGEGKATPAEYGEPGHVDEAVIQAIQKWVLKG